jgi:asparagine synthase (glutamine-hydrolysing)
LDSSAVVGLAQECGVSVETFTVTVDEFRGRALDEAPLAAETARHFGLPHSVISITLADARAGIPAFLAAMDQPTVDGINTWFVTEATRSAGLKVALSGLGGDELLGGYDSFTTVPELRHRHTWTQHVGRIGSAYRHIYSLLCRVMPRLPTRGSESLAAGSGWRQAYQWQRGLFMPWELPYLMHPDAAYRGLEELSKHELWEPIADESSDFAKVSILESSRYMRNQLLRDTDWVGMAHSLELRTPLVDHILTGVASGLAANGLLGEGKSVLGSSVANGLPQSVLDRPKTGFTLPIWHWLNSVDELAIWKRVKWLRRSGTRNYARWAYAIAAHQPEVRDLLN